MFPLHFWFVNWAFRLFTLTVLCFTICIARSHTYPRGNVFILAGFLVLLVCYLTLMAWGPAMDNPRGVMIQVVGQKLIVYASVLSVLILALHARAWLRK